MDTSGPMPEMIESGGSKSVTTVEELSTASVTEGLPTPDTSQKKENQSESQEVGHMTTIEEFQEKNTLGEDKKFDKETSKIDKTRESFKKYIYHIAYDSLKEDTKTNNGDLNGFKESNENKIDICNSITETPPVENICTTLTVDKPLSSDCEMKTKRKQNFMNRLKIL